MSNRVRKHKQDREQSGKEESGQKDSVARPFIKWVGGKGQLLPAILARIPEFKGTYFEPFLGGGAVFFALQPRRARLSDINEELIRCYQSVKQEPKSLIRALRRLRYERGLFYKIRNADRQASFSKWTAPRRAARLIYLNKCGFNGLYRVNSKGHFNVPFGRYSNPKIVDQPNLLACSRALRGRKIVCDSFRSIEKLAKRGDFVYFDPPYAPLSPTSSFTGYAKGGFNTALQVELAQLCKRLHRKGVRFLLSNSSAPLILELYKSFVIELIPARRSVNSNARKRGSVNEVLVRNYRLPGETRNTQSR